MSKEEQELEVQGNSEGNWADQKSDINEPIEDSAQVEELEELHTPQKNQKQKTWVKIVSFVCGVILIPSILTIILAAFEEDTNQWVRQFFGVEKEETFVEKIKRLASNGELISPSCAKLGASVIEVKGACGKPYYESRTIHNDRTTHELRYMNKNKSGYILSFTNEKLTRILLINEPQLANIKLDEIKQVFGPVKKHNTNEEALENRDTVFYNYVLDDSYGIRFTFETKSGKLYMVQLQSEESPPPANMEQKVGLTQKLDSSKSVGDLKGVALAKKIKEWVVQGDVPHYHCGPIGSRLGEVERKCGTESKSVTGYDDHNSEKWMDYKYKEREIGLKFYKDELSLISVRELENPLPMNREHIIEVFGNPVDKKSSFLSPEQFAKYEMDSYELQFFFDEEGNCDYMILKKRGLYDDEFGKLLLSNQQE